MCSVLANMAIVHDSDFFELNVKPESDQELPENNSIESEETLHTYYRHWNQRRIRWISEIIFVQWWGGIQQQLLGGKYSVKTQSEKINRTNFEEDV